MGSIHDFYSDTHILFMPYWNFDYAKDIQPS